MREPVTLSMAEVVLRFVPRPTIPEIPLEELKMLETPLEVVCLSTTTTWGSDETVSYRRERQEDVLV